MILLSSNIYAHSRHFKEGKRYGIWLQRLLIARTKAVWQKLPGAWLEEGRVGVGVGVGGRVSFFLPRAASCQYLAEIVCSQAKESGKCSFQAPVASVWWGGGGE